MSNRAEREYMGRVKMLPCIVCEMLGRRQESITEVHHLREGVGGAQRQSNWLTIPLCTDDHTGPQGFHGDRTYMRILKADELDLLAATLELLNKETS